MRDTGLTWLPQVLFLYYAYLIDLEKGTKTIAPGCQDHSLDGFLKYLQPDDVGSRGTPVKWEGTTGLGGPWTADTLLKPTLDDMVAKVIASGFAGNQDGSLLLPKAGLKPNAKYEEKFGKVADHIVSLNVPPGDERVARMTTAAKKIRDIRVNRPDLLKHEMDALKKVSARGNFGFTPVPSSDGLSIDTKATIATIPDGDRAAKATEAVEKFAIGEEPGEHAGFTINAAIRKS